MSFPKKNSSTNALISDDHHHVVERRREEENDFEFKRTSSTKIVRNQNKIHRDNTCTTCHPNFNFSQFQREASITIDNKWENSQCHQSSWRSCTYGSGTLCLCRYVSIADLSKALLLFFFITKENQSEMKIRKLNPT